MKLEKVLLSAATIKPNEELPLPLALEVGNYQRLHFHVSSDVHPVQTLYIGITFGTQVNGKLLSAKSTVWFEDTVWEREFSHTTSETYQEKGIVLSIPVVAPVLSEIHLHNQGNKELKCIYVSVLGQTN